MSRATHHSTLRVNALQVDDDFGSWTVTGEGVARLHKKKSPCLAMFYPCRCECGTEREVAAEALRGGGSASCGCARKETLKRRFTKHGQFGTRLYRIWGGMHSRCTSKTHPRYMDYGGRGIAMCPEWRDSFEAFADWARSHGYADDLTIERKQVDGDYCPANCEWIPLSKQSDNTRCSVNVTAFGETKSLERWSEDHRCSVSSETVRYRLKQGCSPEDAITMPRRRPGRWVNRNKAAIRELDPEASQN